MSTPIKVGDTVTLTSGGPSMTVERVFVSQLPDGHAACVWFNGTTPVYGNFPIAALTIQKVAAQ